jgi:hypothetical protein
MTPEGRVKRAVTRALDRAGRSVWRFMPVQVGLGATALDFLLCLNGRFVAIETKADPRRKLSPRQAATAEAIVRAGGLVFVLRSVEEATEWERSVLPRLLKGDFDAGEGLFVFRPNAAVP